MIFLPTGRPERANLLPFAGLCLLERAVGCTQIFRVPATIVIRLLKYVCNSEANCGVAHVSGSIELTVLMYNSKNLLMPVR